MLADPRIVQYRSRFGITVHPSLPLFEVAVRLLMLTDMYQIRFSFKFARHPRALEEELLLSVNIMSIIGIGAFCVSLGARGMCWCLRAWTG